jgi:hypothetical protein
MVSSLKIPSDYIEREKVEQLEEIKRRTAVYRKNLHHYLHQIKGKKKEKKENEKTIQSPLKKLQSYL